MKKKKSNKKPYVSFGGNGVDVASVRADDIDKLSIEYLLKKKKPKVLDLGCGSGGHTFRMAEVGIPVVAVDRYDFSEWFNFYRFERGVSNSLIKFVCGDIANLSELVINERFTDAYSQRTIHYLKYEQALELLRFLYEITSDKLYLSVMGIESGAGGDYVGAEMKVEDRFFPLSKECAEKFSIHEDVCLYSKDDFEKLLKDAGWKVESCWQSAFGNIKAVCAH